GLQTGYCADTGGGWSRLFVAHRSQLHPVPDELSDRRAVLIEPLSCAIHAALRARVEPNAEVLLIGAGTVGLLVLLALKELAQPGRITVVAKHGVQREWAEGFGATEVVSPSEAVGEVRRSTRAMKLRPERGQSYLLGGVDVAIDCVGSRSKGPTSPRSGSASSSSSGRTRAGSRPLGSRDGTRSTSRPSSPARGRSTGWSGRRTRSGAGARRSIARSPPASSAR